jgi:hypothetical protein
LHSRAFYGEYLNRYWLGHDEDVGENDATENALYLRSEGTRLARLENGPRSQ